MPITTRRRCLHCHTLQPATAYPVLRRVVHPTTHRVTVVRDVYCTACLANDPQLRLHMAREPYIPDR